MVQTRIKTINIRKERSTILDLGITKRLESIVRTHLVIRMKTPINTAQMMRKSQMFPEDIKKSSVLSRENLSAINNKMTVKIQLMITMIRIVRLCKRDRILLLKIAILSRTEDQRSKSLSLNNPDQSLKETTTVIMRTMKTLRPKKSVLLRELRKSSKVLINLREPPCKPNKLPLMNGLKIYMDALHQ